MQGILLVAWRRRLHCPALTPSDSLYRSTGPWDLNLLTIVCLLTLLLISASANATRKTDVITLYNGDHVTGEIKSLLGGKMSLSTDAMGTINIEWKEIASVVSNYNYEVRLTDGQRFFGSLGPGSVPGTIALTDVFGERSLSWQEVVELRPVEDSFQDRFDIYVSANYSFTKASGVTQTEFRANLDYEDEDAINSMTSRLTLTDTDDETTSSSRITLSRKVYTNRKALYRNVLGGYETNDELGLDYRYTLGAGLGRFFIDNNSRNLTAGMALQVLQERSTGGDTQESVEAVLSGTYSAWRFDSPELDLDFDAQIYPSLTESGRVRADTNATLRWEMFSDLYWDLSIWGSYDNAAIDSEAGELDWGVTTGVGWEF